jgi:hypothetical protein
MSYKSFLKKLCVAAALLLCCCSPSLLLPTTADVTSANKRWAGTDSVALHQGYDLYVNKCGACHVLYRPTKFSEEKWKKEVPDMSPRAHITPQETEMILRYVLTRREVILVQKNSVGG